MSKNYRRTINVGENKPDRSLLTTTLKKGRKKCNKLTRTAIFGNLNVVVIYPLPNNKQQRKQTTISCARTAADKGVLIHTKLQTHFRQP